jgi:hypothetical protein
MASSEPAEAPKSTEVLGKMLSDFDTFEGLLRNGTRQRREKDDSRVAELRLVVREVETAVAQESDRRVEAAKALQGWAETQVVSVRTRLEELLAASHADVLKRIDAVHSRIDALEVQFEKDKIATLAEVDKRNRELVQALQEFREEFEAERKSRLEREQALLDKLGAAEHDSSARWDDERAEREKIYMAIKKRLEEAVDARTKADDRFQASVFTELAAIKNSIQAEARAREAEDDALASGLTAYVQKLQASLALINSEDNDF